MAAFVFEWDVIGYSVALLSIHYLSLSKRASWKKSTSRLQRELKTDQNIRTENLKRFPSKFNSGDLFR